MKFKKVIIPLLVSAFLFTNSLSAFAYQINGTKHLTINETITITKRPNDYVSNFYIKKNLVNDVNQVYSDPYEYVVTNQKVNLKKDAHSNYSFETTLKELTSDTTTFNIVLKSKASQINYNVDTNKVNHNPTYPSDVAKYLSVSDKIESNNNAIILKGKEIVGTETNPYIKAKKIFDFTYTYMDYDLNKGNFSALHALETKVGVCEDYSRLMVALLRSQNVPARTVSGYRIAESFNGKEDISDGRYNHMWVEFYLDGYGWVAADPTISFAGKKFITDKNFADLDSYYFPLSIDGQLSSTAYNYSYIQGKVPEVKVSINTTATFSNAEIATPAPTPKPVTQKPIQQPTKPVEPVKTENKTNPIKNTPVNNQKNTSSPTVNQGTKDNKVNKTNVEKNKFINNTKGSIQIVISVNR